MRCPRAALPSAANVGDSTAETLSRERHWNEPVHNRFYLDEFTPIDYRGRALPSYMNVIGFGPGM